MAISPFSARPASPGGERRRARLAVAIAVVGIVATLLAYGLSPGVRHAVHNVKHAVGNVLDHDHPPAHHAKGTGPTRIAPPVHRPATQTSATRPRRSTSTAPAQSATGR
jgi:hypothetical protein